MVIAFATHARYLDHGAGHGHPERPARLEAVLLGARFGGVDEALVEVEPAPADLADLERVHPLPYLEALQRFCAAGGGSIDADTGCTSASWEAAILAAGAGLSAIEALERGEASAAFCAVRPPGHHARPLRAMGFCLLNNVAVAAAALAERGERVLVVDYDAHHGNGTQEIFYEDPRVLYVSMHEWPLYPGTGRLDEMGDGAGLGTTLNFPLPAGATGDVYLAAIDDVLAPLVEAFVPTWLLVSAGFDAHRRDPIASLGLTAGDFSLITARLLCFVPPARRLVVLEGGYDLQALADSTAAALAALEGLDHRPEAPTSGGPGHEVVDAVGRRWHEAGLL